jgi:hypothetical protein
MFHRFAETERRQPVPEFGARSSRNAPIPAGTVVEAIAYPLLSPQTPTGSTSDARHVSP